MTVKGVTMKVFNFLLLGITFFLFVSCSSSKVSKESEQWITTPSGLQYYDIFIGSGETPRTKQRVFINFIMKTEDGTVVEDTYKIGIPMSFVLGNKDAIEGLEEALTTMKVGGKRKLIIPPELGFGNRSFRNIPPNSKLIVEVELVKAE